MDKPPLRRRLVAAVLMALTLAVITATPATAQTSQSTTASTLSVVNPGNQLFFEFDSVHLQMTATGGAPAYTWSATGLSTYLSINPSTGLISGIATAGIRNVTVTAVDTAGASSSVSFIIRVPLECRTC